jgi:hypothetical protein
MSVWGTHRSHNKNAMSFALHTNINKTRLVSPQSAPANVRGSRPLPRPPQEVTAVPHYEL